MITARHQHDCDVCVLISHEGESDVYYCPNEGSIVVRHSDDGPDYESFTVSIARLAAQKNATWDFRVRLADAFLAGRESARRGA